MKNAGNVHIAIIFGLLEKSAKTLIAHLNIKTTANRIVCQADEENWNYEESAWHMYIGEGPIGIN